MSAASLVVPLYLDIQNDRVDTTPSAVDSSERPVVRCGFSIVHGGAMDSWNGSCQACGAIGGPVTKLSLGKDFFGRPYDRLSPSSDQDPKWYCAPCSMHKNLQRDFRDIRAEFDKLRAGQGSELSKGDEFRRASLRLHEVMAILRGTQQQSPFLSSQDVTLLMERLNTLTMPV